MFIIKYLLSAFLLSGIADPGVDENGWALVERVERVDPAGPEPERDRSIWVIFAKQIGSERFLVSFPDDPQYMYADGLGKQMEVLSVTAEAEYRLQVLDKVNGGGEELLASRLSALSEDEILLEKNGVEGELEFAEIAYRQGGFWVFEKWIASPEHTYFFQTKAVSMDDALHDQFVGSFDLTK